MNRFTNSDTPDNSTMLGFKDTNEITDLPGFAGSDLDEMNLNYISSISAWFSTITWSTSSGADTILQTFSLSPRKFYQNTTVNSQAVSHLTPLAYVSSFFALYRGSIVLTFKLVKTEFHTGRLMVTFTPFDYAVNSAYPAVTQLTSVYAHREIIDIRYGNEFKFVIPYTSFSTWRSAAGTDSAYGNLQVMVLNELVAPSTVPSSIGILVEASAHSDFEWAQPVDFGAYPVQIYYPQMARDNVCEITSSTLGKASTYSSTAPSELCIGESIRSFRSLIKRFNRVVRSSPTLPTQTYMLIVPWAMEIGYADPTVVVGANNGVDTLSHMAYCFTFMRGGIRYKLIDPYQHTTPLYEVCSQPLSASTGAPPANYTYFGTTFGVAAFGEMRPTSISQPAATGGTEVAFPFYNRFHSIPCSSTFQTPATAVNGLTYNPSGTGPRTLGYLLNSPFSGQLDPIILRAGAEDMSFGLFISTPPVVGYSPDNIG
jgi:hypothetical protein